MNLVIEKGGTVRGIYGEAIAIAALGPLKIERASHVEPDSPGSLAGRPVACRGAGTWPVRSSLRCAGSGGVLVGGEFDRREFIGS